MFIVGSNLNEAQRERLTSSLSLRNISVRAYTLDTVQPVFVELLLCSEKLNEKSISPREQQRQQYEQNVHCGKLPRG